MSAAAIASPATLLNARAEWDRLMLAFEAAKAADDQINQRHDAALAAFMADKPPEPEIDLVLIFSHVMGACDIARRRLLYTDDLDQLQHQIIAATGVTMVGTGGSQSRACRRARQSPRVSTPDG